MSILADKIEQFILTKLLEEQEGITLRRNELAEALDCAPSQISYVLSTRFSNDRGFIVQSRRGLGGSITITRVMEPVRTQVLIPLEQTPQRNEEEPVVTIGHIDQVLFQHMKEARITANNVQIKKSRERDLCFLPCLMIPFSIISFLPM